MVKEGTLGKDDEGLGFLGPIPMEFWSSGGIRVVTVEAPDGSYPGTDFVNDFFTVSVNRYLTRDECRKFPTDQPSGKETTGEREIDGIEFHSMKQGGAATSHSWGGTYYHGFFEGSCFELGYGLATAGYGAMDGLKKVNDAEVIAVLEPILETVAIRTPRGATRPSNLPFIRSFKVTPVQAGAPPDSYRISWDVEGAEPSQVWISGANCLGRVTNQKVAVKVAKGSLFTCGLLWPTESTKGSLLLGFSNRAGGKVIERLFVAGRESVSATRAISPPPLPMIISIRTDGDRYWIPHSYPHRCIQQTANYHWLPSGDRACRYVPISAGHSVHIGGIGFLSRDTIWIGSRNIPVASPDTFNINFAVPPSLPEGLYPMSVKSKYGGSNPVMVQIVK